MNNKDFYKATFSQVRTDKNFNIEEFKNRKRKRNRIHKLLVTVAGVCLILITSTSVYASKMFGLRDMLIGNPDSSFSNHNSNRNQGSDANVNSSEDTKETANRPSANTKPADTIPTDSASADTVSDVPSEAMSTDGETSDSESGLPKTPPVEMISLQGFADSAESKAVAEWTNFRDNYDQDGALLEKVGNGPTGLDKRFDLYSVYTQEMADKLDEIVIKYNLNLHNSLTIIENTEELIQKAGTGNFLGTANTAYSTYMYEDGTFHIDGTANLEGGTVIDYQFMNCKKGAFTDTILNIGSIKDYKEWSYKTISGTTVSLALSPKKSLIIADLGESFITVNVLAGTDYGFLDEAGKITASDLEYLANSFDFTLIK